MLSLLTTLQIFDIKCNLIQQLMQLLLSRANYVLHWVTCWESRLRKSIPKEDIPKLQAACEAVESNRAWPGKNTQRGEEVPMGCFTSGMGLLGMKRGWDWTISLRLGYTVFASELPSHMTWRGVGQCGSPALFSQTNSVFILRLCN